MPIDRAHVLFNCACLIGKGHQVIKVQAHMCNVNAWSLLCMHGTEAIVHYSGSKLHTGVCDLRGQLCYVFSFS